MGLVGPETRGVPYKRLKNQYKWSLRPETQGEDYEEIDE